MMPLDLTALSRYENRPPWKLKDIRNESSNDLGSGYPRNTDEIREMVLEV